MASYSVGLPPGSPPPTRAATSTFLINRAKFLPRRASITAFLCLVVAHLEWPLMQYYLFHYFRVRSTSLRGGLSLIARRQARQRDDAVADTGRPAEVAVDVHLDPGRGARRVVGEGRGGVDDGPRRAAAGQAHQRVDARLWLHLDHRHAPTFRDLPAVCCAGRYKSHRSRSRPGVARML